MKYTRKEIIDGIMEMTSYIKRWRLEKLNRNELITMFNDIIKTEHLKLDK